MPQDRRNSGIPFIDDVPWGSHLCVFYETADGLFDVKARFFEPGLDGNERCLWLIPEGVDAPAVLRRLSDAITDLEADVDADRLRLVTAAAWTHDGAAWAELVQEAQADGFDGVRAGGEVTHLTPESAGDLHDSARELAQAIADKPVLLLSTCDLVGSRGVEVLDIARIHNVTVARRRGGWQLFETPPLRDAGDSRALDDVLARLTADSGQSQLTEREAVVLSLLVKGASSKEIARDLGISPRTAEFHRANIIGKLGAKNTADLIRRVLSRG